MVSKDVLGELFILIKPRFTGFIKPVERNGRPDDIGCIKNPVIFIVTSLSAFHAFQPP